MSMLSVSRSLSLCVCGSLMIFSVCVYVCVHVYVVGCPEIWRRWNKSCELNRIEGTWRTLEMVFYCYFSQLINNFYCFERICEHILNNIIIIIIIILYS